MSWILKPAFLISFFSSFLFSSFAVAGASDFFIPLLMGFADERQEMSGQEMIQYDRDLEYKAWEDEKNDRRYPIEPIQTDDRVEVLQRRSQKLNPHDG